jgi:uncharacterized membrane protein YbjE (DUF340 family)
MKLSSLRWLLLPAAAVSGALCVFSGVTPARAAVAAVCGLGWYRLSRAKVRSLDRAVLGIPPRR